MQHSKFRYMTDWNFCNFSFLQFQSQSLCPIGHTILQFYYDPCVATLKCQR